jgi:hypothetical protein
MAKSAARDALRAACPDAFLEHLPRLATDGRRSLQPTVVIEDLMVKIRGMPNSPDFVYPGQLFNYAMRDMDRYLAGVEECTTYIFVCDKDPYVSVAKGCAEHARDDASDDVAALALPPDFELRDDVLLPTPWIAFMKNRIARVAVFRYIVRRLSQHTLPPGKRILLDGDPAAAAPVEITGAAVVRARADLANTIGEGDLLAMFHRRAADVAGAPCVMFLTVDTDFISYALIATREERWVTGRTLLCLAGRRTVRTIYVDIDRLRAWARTAVGGPVVLATALFACGNDYATHWRGLAPSAIISALCAYAPHLRSDDGSDAPLDYRKLILAAYTKRYGLPEQVPPDGQPCTRPALCRTCVALEQRTLIADRLENKFLTRTGYRVPTEYALAQGALRARYCMALATTGTTASSNVAIAPDVREFGFRATNTLAPLSRANVSVQWE